MVARRETTGLGRNFDDCQIIVLPNSEHISAAYKDGVNKKFYKVKNMATKTIKTKMLQGTLGAKQG